MSKKELRKELESKLIKAIDGVLKRINDKASANMKKNVRGASKTLSRKFYKTLPSVEKPASKKTPSSSSNSTSKTKKTKTKK